jgi:signal transduction histidine kinase/DNA-binding CsgD family transcriptional regulator
MPETLLEIIARLQQQHLATSQGRRLLLDYARKRARAQLGLLFLLDPAGQQLLLLDQCGHGPRVLRRTPASSAITIPAGGLFGAALQQQGLMSSNEDGRDPLPEEQAWMWRNGHVLLCAVGVSAGKGVMALCAGPRATVATTPLLAKQAEQDILLCAALLGSYLTRSDTQVPDDVSPDAQVPDDVSPDAHKGHPYISAGHPARRDEIDIDYSHILRRLAAFYEAGLVAVPGDGAPDEQAICQAVADALREALDAAGGHVWLYAPSRGRFALRAGSGEDSGSLGLVEDELARLADGLQHREQGDRLPMHDMRDTNAARVVAWSPGRMVVLHLLEYAPQPTGLAGAVALTLEGSQELSVAQRLLLVHLCRAAAVMLHFWQARAAERQAAIDAERSRIARDIHDGAAQQIAQAIHALEYAGRVVERQPVTARQEIDQARETLVESLGSLRQSIASLLPARLERAGLDEALAALLDDFRRSNPDIEVHYEGARVKLLPPSLEVPIYRLAQEALQNARKHARATLVTVQMQALPGMIVIQVSDNGAGFDVEQARRNTGGQRPHFGLRSMQERVEQVGGAFMLTSKPGEGTTVKACFPLPTRATALTSREREVLRLLVEGASNRAIAERLSISLETVKSHMRHIMQKLGVKDRTQAAVLAARQQWV